MEFTIFKTHKYYLDRTLLIIYLSISVILIFMMTGGTWSDAPTFFEKHDLPFSAYLFVSIVAIIILILAFNLLLRIGSKNRLIINTYGLKIITDFLQREKIVKWEQVTSIKRDYENWNLDVDGQIWIIVLTELKKNKKFQFLVDEAQSIQLDELVKIKLKTAPNNGEHEEPL